MRIQFIQDIIDKIRGKKKNTAPQFSLPTSEEKRDVIIQYANEYKCSCLVETGTFLGDTVEAMRSIFDNVHSIELDTALYEKACMRFSEASNVTIHQGDSGKLLKNILPQIDKKILFWLDGHYSAGITAKGDKNTPILEELATISKNNQKNHIILIDDARCFGVEDDYPTIEVLKKTAAHLFPNYGFEVENDIIRIAIETSKSALKKALKDEVAAINISKVDKVKTSGEEWQNNSYALKQLILNSNPDNFLNWNVIKYTMFVTNQSVNMIKPELSFLQSAAHWEDVYRPAIKENKAGNPEPCELYHDSSCNLIHHAYHIAQFEATLKCKAADADLILELGGGYGGMCRLLFNLGFKGKYIIFDLPLFGALQKYFLKILNLPILSINDFTSSKTGICCISDIADLEKLLDNHSYCQNKIFIGTWSISETPLEFRKKILQHLDSFNLFLIAYQNYFQEVDNVKFFADYQEHRSDINWISKNIEHASSNCYLFGNSYRKG